MPTHTLAELARLCSAELDGDGTLEVDGPAALSEAGPRQVSFLANPRYEEQLATTRAAAVVVAPQVARPRASLTLLRVADPSRAFSVLVRAFVPEQPAPAPGVHASATLDPRARVHPTAVIGPLCTLEAGAQIAAGAVLVARVHVGADAQVGADSVLHPGVVLYPRVEVGARCILHAGCVLGSDGFGFEPTGEGWEKIPQCGTVIVEDEVEIGANATIDRARFGATRIGRGAKLDNLVHVAHNVVIGEAALLVAQVGVAGSSRIGRRAILAGQVGITGHITIGDGARLAGQAGPFGDVPAGADWLGTPAAPRLQALRQMALVRRLPEFEQRLRALEGRLGQRPGTDPGDPEETT